MGGTFYKAESRSLRATNSGYHTKSFDNISTQTKEKKVHKDMDPKDVKFRESRDSEAHPFTFPICFFLDVTGSMQEIPQEMIRDGLPTMMSKIIQGGVPDVALMFGAIGDHEYDDAPVQVGQFESGDEELDMWLTRTWLEKGGGGNAGESYPLAWYFAANHTVTDAWEKRKEKGLLVTVGDEPFLRSFPASAIKEIMGNTAATQGTVSAEDLYKAAQERWHVYHLFMEHGHRKVDQGWKDLLGQDVIVVRDAKTVPQVIAELALKHQSHHTTTSVVPVDRQEQQSGNNANEDEDVVFIK